MRFGNVLGMEKDEWELAVAEETTPRRDTQESRVIIFRLKGGSVTNTTQDIVISCLERTCSSCWVHEEHVGSFSDATCMHMHMDAHVEPKVELRAGHDILSSICRTLLQMW